MIRGQRVLRIFRIRAAAAASGPGIGRWLLNGTRRAASGCVAIDAVESLGAVAAELILAVRSLIGAFGQVPLEVLPAPFVPDALNLALQFAQLTFFLVHVAEDTRRSLKV